MMGSDSPDDKDDISSYARSGRLLRALHSTNIRTVGHW